MSDTGTNETEITKLALSVMNDDRLREARIADYRQGVSPGDWGENQLKTLAEISGIDDTDRLLDLAVAVSKERMRIENDRESQRYYEDIQRRIREESEW